MTHGDDLERVLRDAFAAKAQAAIGDDRVPPSVDLHSAPHLSARRGRFLAPLAAAAAVVLAAGLVFALRGSGTTDGHAGQRPGALGSTASRHASGQKTTSASASPAAKAVHVRLKWSDGSQFGVGVPVIAYLSRKITDARAFAAATSVTVDGTPVAGAWYFETTNNEPGYPLEAHYRLQNYWPAHAKIAVKMPLQGLSAGPGLAYDDSLTLAFTTGAANIATVSDATHTLTLVSDGRTVGTYPVSLGASNTPTSRGTKVIMEKGLSICMSGPGYHECNIKYTQRLTYGGEYLHAAPWNVGNLGKHDSSNGCTNLSTPDAATLYTLLEIGDVVRYPDAHGPALQLGQGYADWNVPWSVWLTGGAVPTR
ncbi:MAG TPA: L,D-transpeptidase [Jatrophihabitantaceae bacterium]|jgi:lipoprotein-anchoring transpeptidase ErfK/SrfK|nr:L,D-transpeptidase [Jatrophihabitantaceae bacterium]